jgi:hypothetical protein
MTGPERTAGDPRKQPLWQMPQKPRSTMSVLLGGVGVMFLVFVSALVIDPRIEEHVFSSPPLAVEVTVLRVESGVPPDEAPALFRHWVRLPDGTETRLESPRLFRPGSRVEGVLTRGRISGRLRLGAPYRLVSEPE